jgi:class 3 adenylate cyclase
VLATRTFLFSDLRDFTPFVERHGDAAAASLIADYRRVVRAELARHEGGEVKTEGESFYVVFDTSGSAVTFARSARRSDEAAEVFRAMTEYWQRAKATWYLGRLTDWARGLGVASDTG